MATAAFTPRRRAGGRIHACFGGPLARMEGEIVFATLTRRLVEPPPEGHSALPQRRPPLTGRTTHHLHRGAVASLYGVLIARRPVTTPWGTGGLTWLLVTAAANLTAGILAFRAGERAAGNRGSLARY